MTLKSSCLPSYGEVSLTGTDVDQRARQERADAVDHDGEPALDLARDQPLDDGGLLHRLLEVVPGLEALGLVARQARGAVAVLDRLDRDGDEVAFLDLDLAVVVLEFLDGNERLGLEAGVDDDDVVVDARHLGGDELALAHFLARERFLEERGEAVGGGRRGGQLRSSHRVEVLVMIVGPSSARTLFLAWTGSCRRFRSAPPARAPRPGPFAQACGSPRRGVRSPFTRRSLALACEPRCPACGQHGRDGGVDRHVRRIQDHGVRGGPKRRCTAAGIARVAFLDIAQKTLNININSTFRQLPPAPLGARLRARPSRTPWRRPPGNTTVPMSRPSATSPGGRRKARWRSNRASRTGACTATREAAAETASVAQRRRRRPPRPAGWRRRRRRPPGPGRPGRAASASVRVEAGRQRLVGHQPVERAAVEVVESQRPGDALGDRPLARGRRPVDGDDRDALASARRALRHGRTGARRR